MIISSREWRIIENNKSSNAEFHDFYNDGDGCFKPTIILGTQTNNKTEIASQLIHEILEIILTEDNKRWAFDKSPKDTYRKLFIFDHDYLNLLQQKILTALLTSGFFKLENNREDDKEC